MTTVPREFDPYAEAQANPSSPLFDTDINKTLNDTNPILLGSTERSKNFAGNIATVGPGENIQAALQMVKTAGGGTVVLRPGNYVLSAILSIPAGVALEGSSRDNVVIDCNDSYGIQVMGSDEYTTGTIAATNGDATITGSGTTWTAAMAGRSILVDGFWYEIASVTDATHLELTAAFEGGTVSGLDYSIATILTNATLRRLTIHNATGSGVTVRSANEPNLDDLYIYDCGTGVDMDYVVYPVIRVTATECGTGMNAFQMHGYKIDFSAFEYCTGDGIVMEACGNATFIDSQCNRNGGVGISFTDCYDTAFLSNAAIENASHGLEFVSGNSDLQFMATTADGNGGDGYKLTATSDRITISSTAIINNGGYGVNIAASTCDNNYIIAPSFENNTSGDINDDGTDTTIISNFGNNGVLVPIYEPINGSTLPVPIAIMADGTAIVGDANDTDADAFHGFIAGDYSAQTPAAYGTNPTSAQTSTTFSHTLPAGTDRTIIFIWMARHNPGNPTKPTGVTFNGNAFTEIGSTVGNRGGIAFWRYNAGTGAQVTANIVVTGSSGNGGERMHALNYNYVDQTTPVADDSGTNGTGVSSLSSNVTPDQPYALCISAAMYADGDSTQRITALPSNGGGFTERVAAAEAAFSDYKVAEGYVYGTSAETVAWTFQFAANESAVYSIVLNNSRSTLATAVVGGKLKGFGSMPLTPGTDYYLSNTRGQISTTPGATSIKVAKALSADEIVIIQS